MAYFCAVKGCLNKFTVTKDNKNIVYHKFPSNKEQFDAWVRFCGRATEWRPRKYLGICSEHFAADCYDDLSQLRQNVVGAKTVRRLALKALPSLKAPPEIPELPEGESGELHVPRMVLRCCVPDCDSSAPKYRLFRIPSKERLSKNPVTNLMILRRHSLWMKVCRLNRPAKQYDRVCSRHFHSGQPASFSDSENRDWIPSLHIKSKFDDDYENDDDYEYILEKGEFGFLYDNDGNAIADEGFSSDEGDVELDRLDISNENQVFVAAPTVVALKNIYPLPQSSHQQKEAVVESSIQPSEVVKRSVQSAATVKMSSQPAAVVKRSIQPSAVVKKSIRPAEIVKSSDKPAAVSKRPPKQGESDDWATIIKHSFELGSDEDNP
ncbi:uncharacterized protein LOC129747017 [Uranotaenia lowii]|uniref:uncharacterized protein LOC129747017 n=1 Tax=Uranotaenia lowii TaxID=190385 RepID=UPI002479F4F4|nr:uncharacterized protein LOC129747017 [Uranotaenia lowii]